MAPHLSIVIPSFNEEAAIMNGNLSRVAQWLHENCPDSELIVVDDGSVDKTPELASHLANRVITIPHSGKAAAIIAGIKIAGGEVVLFTDMDLDTPISEAGKLLKAISQGADIAIGSRGHTRQGATIHRRILSIGHSLLRSLLLNLKLSDSQCGFKAFKRDAALRILEKMRIYRADSNKPCSGYCVNSGFDLEFLHVAQRLGFKISEAPVVWKFSQGRRVRIFKEAFRGIYDIVRIATMKRKPL